MKLIKCFLLYIDRWKRRTSSKQKYSRSVPAAIHSKKCKIRSDSSQLQHNIYNTIYSTVHTQLLKHSSPHVYIWTIKRSKNALRDRIEINMARARPDSVVFVESAKERSSLITCAFCKLVANFIFWFRLWDVAHKQPEVWNTNIYFQGGTFPNFVIIKLQKRKKILPVHHR